MIDAIFKLLKKLDLLKLLYWRVRGVGLKVVFRIKNRSLYLGKDAQIIGTNKVMVGKSCSFGDQLWLNIKNAGSKDKLKTVFIGNFSNIGRNNFITVSDGLVIGDYFFSSCYCVIIGASHESNPLQAYISAPVSPLGQSIEIGSNVFMGSHAKVVGGVTIGFGCVIGAGALVTSDIPPLSQVVGSPAKIISRYSLARARWEKGPELQGGIISETDYLELLRAKCPSVSIPYHAASVRNGWI